MTKLIPIIFLLFFTTLSYASSKQFDVQPFSTIKVNGPIRLNIINGGGIYQVGAEGLSRDIKHLKIDVENRQLSLQSFAPLVLNVRGRHLRQLVATGDSNLFVNLTGCNYLSLKKTGKGNLILNGPVLLGNLEYDGSGFVKINHLINLTRIKYRGCGDVVLRGVSHLECLDFNGAGHLTMRWIDSCSLKIKARGCGLIELAGVAQRVEADIHNAVDFDGRFLRTQTAAVSTYDCARADIFILDNMYAWAQHHSNIYYYNRPRYFYREMEQSGSVLDMTTIPGAYLHF